MDHWDPALETGDEALDERHRELFQLLAAVLAATAAGDRTSAERLLERLHAETVDHFAEEQGRMAELDDPALPRHREAHEAFLEDFGRLRWELRRRGLTPLFRLWIASRFAGWLRLHTRTFDAALAQHAAGGVGSGGCRPGPPPWRSATRRSTPSTAASTSSPSGPPTRWRARTRAP